MHSTHPNYISTQELANYLGISQTAVLKRIYKGLIKAEKIGRSYAISASYIEENFPDFIFSKKESDDAVSVMEAAEILGISRVAVFKKIKKGIIKAKRVGRHYVIERSELLSPSSKRSVPVVVTDKEFVSIPELSKLIGKSRSTLARWVLEGRLKARKVGRHYVVAREDIPASGQAIQETESSIENYLSVAQVAERLGISRVAVFKKIKSGKIRAIKIGRSYAIEAERFQSFFIDKTKE